MIRMIHTYMGKVETACCLLLIACLFGCTGNPEETGPDWDVAFFPLGAKVQFEATAPVQRLTAFNADGTRVAHLTFPVPPRQTEPLYFEWTAGETYRFEATLETGAISVQEVTAPRTYPRGNLEIAVPYGAAAPRGQKALVLQGSEMTATLLITNGTQPTTFDLELCLPESVRAVRFPSTWEREVRDTETCLSTTGRLGVAAEVWYRELVLQTAAGVRAENPEISGSVRFTTAAGETWEQQTTVRLRIATLAEISGNLSVESVEMPTDATGRVDPRQRADTLSYGRPLFRWLGTQQVDRFQPITYQTLRLRNSGTETIHVAVSALNTDPKFGIPMPFLSPPETVDRGTDRSAAFASLPGGTVTAVPLPIYFHPVYLKQGIPTEAIPGTYQREITVKVWGSTAPILLENRPLHLIVPNRVALFVSLAAILSSCIGFAGLLRHPDRLFSGFTTKHLIVISLFSTTVFVAVTIPSTLFFNLAGALLGPVSVLLSGLVNEGLYYALLTALLIYINGDPTRSARSGRGSGVILLVAAVRLLLGGVTFGLLTPMAIVYAGTSVLLLETGFLLVRNRGLFAWALVLGICDALAVYVDFQLSILFYRLFYADWYIALRILVEGFAYTFIGVLLGARLGRGLWRVTD